MPAVTRPAAATTAVDGQLDHRHAGVAAGEALGRVEERAARAAPLTTVTSWPARRSARTSSGKGAQPRPPLTQSARRAGRRR